MSDACQFCAVRSYLSTAAKHGPAYSKPLVMLAEGRALDARCHLIKPQQSFDTLWYL
jgi:hypothetical protein